MVRTSRRICSFSHQALGLYRKGSSDDEPGWNMSDNNDQVLQSSKAAEAAPQEVAGPVRSVGTGAIRTEDPQQEAMPDDDELESFLIESVESFKEGAGMILDRLGLGHLKKRE